MPRKTCPPQRIQPASKMKQQTVERAREMLASVLAGESFCAAGKRHGLCRSTAEREVKALVRLACARSGVGTELQDQAAASLQGLRQLHALVSQAVRWFDADEAPRSSTWDIDAREIAEGAERLRTRSRNAARDVALLYVLFTTGAKPVEIARLQVRDYLEADGGIRRRSTLRQEASVNGRSRPLFFMSERACLAVDGYLHQRLQRQHGVGTAASAYRGLDPVSPLFLTDDGRRFELRCRSRTDARATCRLMSATFHAIFQRAGWPGLTTQAVRRMVARRLLDKGTTPMQAAQLLGLAGPTGVRRLIGPTQATELGAAVEELA
jgi:integrase